MREPTLDELTEIADHERHATQAQAKSTGSPCFGLLRVRNARTSRDILLGERTSIDRRSTTVDWRTAPLASVFFGYREGEPFELESEDRTITGEVEIKALYTFDRDKLTEIRRPNKSYRRSDDDAWKVITGETPLELRPIKKRRRVDPIDVQLDTQQRQIVDLPPDRSVLVLGEAGFGKTTAALHRLAAIVRRADRALSALVIVSTPGLARLSTILLDRLGVKNVEVSTYDHWILKEARRAFPYLPRRDSTNTTPAVMRLKRHPALRALLPAIAAKRVLRPRQYLLHLFGDRALMEQVVWRAAGAIPKYAIREVLEHTHIQFSETTEEEFAHVDRDRLATLDGRRIDEGTPLENARSIDPEDGAVLFEIRRLQSMSDPTARKKLNRISQYDLIVIDEAQERAPIELAAIARARKPGGSIIVAGDANQQTDDTAYFPGWIEAMKELDVGDYERIVLVESHRSPPEVTRFARAIVGGDRSARAVRVGRRGRATKRQRLLISRFPSECHLEARLIDELEARQAGDPLATIAIIARDEASARLLHATLARTVSCSLVLDGRFTFEPGIVITTVPQVKGLEFYVVIVPDADPAHYPDTPEARSALYVAVTRAIDQVMVAGAKKLSPIVSGIERDDAEVAGQPVLRRWIAQV